MECILLPVICIVRLKKSHNISYKIIMIKLTENFFPSTAITVEDPVQEQILQNIKLHKEVLSSVKQQPWNMRRKLRLVRQAQAYIRRHEGELQERLAMSRSTRDVLARFNIVIVKVF